MTEEHDEAPTTPPADPVVTTEDAADEAPVELVTEERRAEPPAAPDPILPASVGERDLTTTSTLDVLHEQDGVRYKTTRDGTFVHTPG